MVYNILLNRLYLASLKYSTGVDIFCNYFPELKSENTVKPGHRAHPRLPGAERVRNLAPFDSAQGAYSPRLLSGNFRAVELQLSGR